MSADQRSNGGSGGRDVVVLSAFRRLTRLVAHARSHEELLQGVCEALVQDEAYGAAAILLGHPPVTSLSVGAHALKDPGLEPFISTVEAGDVPRCAPTLLATDGPASNIGGELCRDCPLSAHHGSRCGIGVRIAWNGKVYGLLLLVVPPSIAVVPEEQQYVEEAATDLALALATIDEDIIARAAAAERYQQLVETTSDWLWEIGEDDCYSYASPQVHDLLGYRPEEILGKRPFDFMEANEAERLIAFFEDLKQQQAPIVRLINRARHRDGHEVILETSGRPIVEDGVSRGYRGIDRDVTRRVRQEEEQAALANELGKTVSLFEGVLNSIPDLIGILDVEHRVIRYNEAGYSFLGLTPEEAHGRHCYELIGREGPCTNCATKEAIETGCTARRERYVEGMDVWLDARSYPMFDDDGNVVLVIEHIRDISERKRSEQALRDSEMRYRTLFESAGEAIFLVEDSYCIDCNARACDMFGRPREEIIGKTPLDFSPPLQADGTETKKQFEVVIAALEDGQTHTLEWDYVYVDGSIINTEISLKKIFNESDRQLVLAAVRDVTNRKRTEEALRHSQKLESLGVLAGGVAHDFNNLLTAIIGNADLALFELPQAGNESAQRFLTEVKKAARRAAELCSHMLAYAGKAPFVIQEVDLRELVSELTSFLRLSISKKVRVVHEFDQHLPRLRVDPAQIRQVVMNLVTNGAEAHGDEGGTVTVSLGCHHYDKSFFDKSYLADQLESGEYVVLKVSDTGTGMDDTVLSHIFEPFFSTKFLGRGLGLAAVVGIVRSHHGAITVESTVGEGTTFFVYLPIEGSVVSTTESDSEKEAVAVRDEPATKATHASHEERIEKAGRAEQEEAPRARRQRVLLVDDEDFVRQVAGELLERLGYDVLVAVDGCEALELFDRHHDSIDCVLLDLMMPRKDGLETLAELRARDNTVRVILSSGYTVEELADHCGNVVPDGLVHKPYELETLATELQRVLALT